MRILCVCTGNVCRSPMLEALLRREYEKAMSAQTTRDCREGCNGCGLQKLKGVCKGCE